MPKSTDLIGRQFGKLTVVEKVTQKTAEIYQEGFISATTRTNMLFKFM